MTRQEREHAGGLRLEEFKVGEVVWAKMPSFPWWPAQIIDPHEASAEIRRWGRRGATM